MASSSTHTSAPAPRVLWKGAISFGLVHIPVALYSATQDSGIDFDWLDKRSMDPVGYKRINKRTGREISREHIVRGVAQEDGHYAVLSDAEIKAAYPRTTQTIEIEHFVPADGIPFLFLERPYYVAPIHKGAKVYALLREALRKSGRIGVARVVIQTRQHLAALVPMGPGLVLNLLRWGAEIRPWEGLPLPADGIKKAGLSERELKMAQALIDDMAADWNADDYEDEFREQILALVARKVKAGQTEAVTQPEAAEGQAPAGAQIVDLTELLQRSLRGGKRTPAKAAADKAEPEKAAPARRAPARKSTSTAARKKKSGSSASRTPARKAA
ncbi:Ku protein [Xenophilus arseniciresistens]|uniref:Non-homologous end joining protein Ku n=1 Tax=Xenophilus arseniciresistens TaxID=1283306 RepID=A0AAE3NCU9_9BURK|nr:Ku protein [Xenophilus arseniciresistens]MDA7418734.1 Ku protein [Xenophilus arseniciresistens]